jgi:hypothetical protein
MCDGFPPYLTHEAAKKYGKSCSPSQQANGKPPFVSFSNRDQTRDSRFIHGRTCTASHIQEYPNAIYGISVIVESNEVNYKVATAHKPTRSEADAGSSKMI